MSGLFITFEGGDGSGKSTQAELLSAWLVSEGHTVVRSREPGGTELGEELREIVLHRRGHIAPRAEALIYAADRAHNIATKVRPAVERGEIVIQDRYLDSSVAYQGVGRVLDPTEVRDLSLWATEGFLPDLTILLDLDEAIGRQRLDDDHKRYDRLESEEGDFHARVRSGYLALAAAEPDRFSRAARDGPHREHRGRHPGSRVDPSRRLSRRAVRLRSAAAPQRRAIAERCRDGSPSQQWSI